MAFFCVLNIQITGTDRMMRFASFVLAFNTHCYTIIINEYYSLNRVINYVVIYIESIDSTYKSSRTNLELFKIYSI